ncbi:MAG: lipocalin family protein [Bacteroidetes bacterium]|nr:lipocalin family protein [Bacteroidota bacterium]
MKLTNTLVAVCCGLVLFASCKKNENEDTRSATTKMLENGKWQLSASTATVNYMGKDSTIDLYSETDECDKDDFIVFAGDGKATIDEAANKCPDDEQTETAPWVLLSNDTKLAITDSNPDTMDIEITNTQMKLKQIKQNSSGSPVTYLDTYKNIK